MKPTDFQDQEETKEEKERNDAWQEFRQVVQLHSVCPPDFSVNLIRAIMAVLKETV